MLSFLNISLLFFANLVILSVFYQNQLIKYFFPSQQHFLSEQLPLVLEWTGYKWQNISFDKSKCQNPCIFTRDKSVEPIATVVTYHTGTSLLTSFKNATSIPGKVNVFVNFEPPLNTNPLYRQVADDFFNVTATYRLDSDFPMIYDYFRPLNVNDTDRWFAHEVG